MRVEIYKAAIMLENARQDIQQLEARVLLLSSRSAIRTAIQIGILILITTFAFSGSLPDIPRRTGRSRRETDTLL